MADGKTIDEIIQYKLADGKAVPVEVSSKVAEFLRNEEKRERTHRRDDRRFLDADGYTEGETELLLYDLGILGRSILDEVQERERRKLINQAIDRLPPRQKAYIHAYYFKALTYEEIGKLEGVSKPTISIQINRALIRLKATLSKMDSFRPYLVEVTEE